MARQTFGKMRKQSKQPLFLWQVEEAIQTGPLSPTFPLVLSILHQISQMNQRGVRGEGNECSKECLSHVRLQ